MSITEEIVQLERLKENGSISEEEYQKAKESLFKESLISKNQSTGERLSEVNMWSKYIHFSQFCGFIIPVIGFSVPIILWQMKKSDSKIIDRHGIVVVNWIISEFAYAFSGYLLIQFFCFFMIRAADPSVFFLLAPLSVFFYMALMFALGIVSMIFSLIGGIKAGYGDVWSYPLSIKFLKKSKVT